MQPVFKGLNCPTNSIMNLQNMVARKQKQTEKETDHKFAPKYILLYSCMHSLIMLVSNICQTIKVHVTIEMAKFTAGVVGWCDWLICNYTTVFTHLNVFSDHVTYAKAE